MKKIITIIVLSVTLLVSLVLVSSVISKKKSNILTLKKEYNLLLNPIDEFYIEILFEDKFEQIKSMSFSDNSNNLYIVDKFSYSNKRQVQLHKKKYDCYEFHLEEYHSNGHANKKNLLTLMTKNHQMIISPGIVTVLDNKLEEFTENIFELSSIQGTKKNVRLTEIYLEGKTIKEISSISIGNYDEISFDQSDEKLILYVPYKEFIYDKTYIIFKNKDGTQQIIQSFQFFTELNSYKMAKNYSFGKKLDI